MRTISLVTAIAVVSILYVLVFERDVLKGFSNGQNIEELAGDLRDGPELNTDASIALSKKKKSEKPIAVVVVKSTAKTIDSAVILRGETAAARSVEVRSETSGQVVNEPLRKGKSISQGQILCSLDSGTRQASLADAVAGLAEARARVPETRAKLDEAKARLTEAKINFNAATKLSEGGYASETRVASAKATVRAAEASIASATAGFDSTRSKIQSAEASVAIAKKEIDRISLKAPFAGILETDTAELGTLLQPGALCAKIIQLNPIKFVGFASETELNKIVKGSSATAKIINGKEIEGKVTFISRSADQTTRTFRVEIEASNADLSISKGQTSEILIASDGTQAHLLPQSALTLNDDGALGVRTVDDASTVVFFETDLIRDTMKGVWLKGLPEETNVIVIGQEYVTDGVKVQQVFQEVKN
ncbi:efflux RND transporter periplasmic adaptor subunit [Rhodobacteraceae bacterium]|nr:efflux RND transporter periplasmic adaptor subunit [Paracoccaceae bacterium]